MTPNLDAIIYVMNEEQRAVLEYHSHPDRFSSCGNMGADLQQIFAGHLQFSDDGRLELTELGQAVRARIIERKNDDQK